MEVNMYTIKRWKGIQLGYLHYLSEDRPLLERTQPQPQNNPHHLGEASEITFRKNNRIIVITGWKIMGR